MTLFSKIGLSRRYGKAIYVISAFITVAMSSLVFFEPLSIPVFIILKLLSIPVVYYLYLTMHNKTEMYFYLNFGISRNEYYFIPFVVEFIGFVLLMIIIGKIGYAIR